MQLPGPRPAGWLSDPMRRFESRCCTGAPGSITSTKVRARVVLELRCPHLHGRGGCTPLDRRRPAEQPPVVGDQHVASTPGAT